MSYGTNVIYAYDGSFEGMLTCVFESFARHEIPIDIIPESELQPTLYEIRYVSTDFEKAKRVCIGVNGKISGAAWSLIYDGYYTCHIEKEKLILDFIRLGFHEGSKVTLMLGNPVVDELTKAVRAMSSEAHQLQGFVRFSDYGKALVAVIEPKNYVLPRLAHHFCDRYRNEAFMIYDKRHACALMYAQRKCRIVPLDDFEELPPDGEEIEFRRLWKLFYDTVAIKERENPRCRMSHMQKRYWSHLTEMQDESYFRQPQEQLVKGTSPKRVCI